MTRSARLGIQLQSSDLPDKLRVGEALELFAAFYPDPADPLDLMEMHGLTEISMQLCF